MVGKTTLPQTSPERIQRFHLEPTVTPIENRGSYQLQRFAEICLDMLIASLSRSQSHHTETLLLPARTLRFDHLASLITDVGKAIIENLLQIILFGFFSHGLAATVQTCTRKAHATCKAEEGAAGLAAVSL